MIPGDRETHEIASDTVSLARRIRSLPWGSELVQAAANAQADIGEVRDVARGEPVVREGAPAESVFAVIDGVLRVDKARPFGQPQIVGFLFAGDLFGVAHGERYTCSARATVACKLLMLPRMAFERLCDRHPGVQRVMLQMASNELAAAQDHLVILGRKSAVERVASFLIALDDRSRRQGRAPNALIWVPMRRVDIANHLGLTLETVSRTVSDLKRRGIIQSRSMREIQIRDRARLAQLAEGR